MPKGPRIPPTVKRIIAEEALKNRDAPRMVLVERLKERIGPMVRWMPADETIANLVSWAWNHEPSPLDEPWSLGASIEHNIPSEANQDLLKIWKWCIVIGKTFTIREALWLARLRGVVAPDNLLLYAVIYAMRQRACELLGKGTIDTAGIDAELAFTGNEWAQDTAIRMGIIKEKEVLNEYMGQDVYFSVFLSQYNLRPSEIIIMREDLSLKEARKHGQMISEGADMVYAMWLRRISEGPGWKNMSKRSKQFLAKRLREEIAKESEYFEDLWRACTENKDYELAQIAHQQGWEWEPSTKLLKRVGIEPASWSSYQMVTQRKRTKKRGDGK